MPSAERECVHCGQPLPDAQHACAFSGASFYYIALALAVTLSACVWLIHPASPSALAVLHHLVGAAGLAYPSATATPPTTSPSSSFSLSPSPSLTASTTAMPSVTPSPTLRPRGRRHALVLGGVIRSMRECIEPQLQRLGHGVNGSTDLFAHVGATNPKYVKSNADVAAAWDATQLQWLRGVALRVVAEDLNWEAGGSNLTLIPQDARAEIPSWPFPVEGPDNPLLNLLASAYRRWRLLHMVEEEEAAGGFAYASITYMRPDLCPCAKDAYDLDALFPPPDKAQPDRGQPLKVYSVAPAAAAAPVLPAPVPTASMPSAPAPSAPAPFAHVLYTPASYGRAYHVALLDRWVDDNFAVGEREAMGWYLSMFSFSEVLSGHRGVRFHPETLSRQALLYGMELKAGQSNAVQEMHIFDSQQMRYCLMREPGTHQCDPGCTVRQPD